jgi:hypothetical protein
MWWLWLTGRLGEELGDAGVLGDAQSDCER